VYISVFIIKKLKNCFHNKGNTQIGKQVLVVFSYEKILYAKNKYDL